MSSQFFRVAPRSKDEYSFLQVIRNRGPRFTQPISPGIEVNQKNHKPVGVSIHFRDVVYPEAIQDLLPAACLPKYLNSPRRQTLIEVKAVGQLPVGIIF